jgi:excisionase family DNA binding protein
MDRVVMTAGEAAEYIGIGINQMYELLKAGEIPAARSGKNYKIPRPLLEKWIVDKALKGEQL